MQDGESWGSFALMATTTISLSRALLREARGMTGASTGLSGKAG